MKKEHKAMPKRFTPPLKLKWQFVIGVAAFALALIVSQRSFRPGEARAQADCSAIANQLKALESERARLVKNLQKPGDSGQLKELDSEILAKQRELNKCTGPPMCNGMRVCTAEEDNTPPHLIVAFPGPNGMTLHGYLYVPGVGTKAQLGAVTRKYPAMICNHGSEEEPSTAEHLARLYLDHGFAFFFPHRHGQGLSKDAGPYIVDLENQLHSDLASVGLHELYNKDVLAAVDWLKSQPFVDPRRIAMSGGSYGGIQTLLTAEKDPGIRAYVAFTPGTQSWGNELLRRRLIAAVQNEKEPMFVIQARGDYTLAPLETLAPVLGTKGNPNKWKVKLYPKFGCTDHDAHALFGGSCGGIVIWDQDVLAFLDQWVK